MTNDTSVNKFGAMEWKKNWAGEWSLLTCTYLGFQYTRQLEEELGITLEYSLFISRKGYSSAFFSTPHLRAFGEKIVRKILDDRSQAGVWCEELKKRTDVIRGLIKDLMKTEVAPSDYEQFIRAFYSYGVPHRAIKVGVDFLPADVLKELLPAFTEARLYAEPVYTETEQFMQYYATQLSKRIGIPAEHLLCLTKDELEAFLKNEVLPDRQDLANRYELGSLLFERGAYHLLEGQETMQLEALMQGTLQSLTELKGTTAFQGQARGVVRVILDPGIDTVFNQGDVLVTGMTRPEYLSYIKKSSAFITDAGGMLSHAAITARELKKPCIVGTETATKILKTGDEIEVDATQGIVRILNKAQSN